MDPSVLRPILEQTWDALGHPPLGATSTRDSRNQFFLAFCAVMHHGHPDLNPRGDTRWVAKSAGNGRPQSDDSIAFLDAGRLRSWDLIIGAGADGFRFVDASGEGDDITGQEPIVPPRSALPPVRTSGSAAAGAPAADAAAALQRTSEPWIALVDARFQQLRLGDESQQREWMARVAFVLAQKVDARIGQKRADPTRPVSRNTLGVGATGALEAIVIIDEQTKARTWQPLGTVAQVWVAPPAFTDMADVLAATMPTPGPAGGSSGAEPPVDVGALRAQLLAAQDALAHALRLLN